MPPSGFGACQRTLFPNLDPCMGIGTIIVVAALLLVAWFYGWPR
jgi:hypothetical protein